jgi:hypothetical protein
MKQRSAAIFFGVSGRVLFHPATDLTHDDDRVCTGVVEVPSVHRVSSCQHRIAANQ